jgi:hypothetical protein
MATEMFQGQALERPYIDMRYAHLTEKNHNQTSQLPRRKEAFNGTTKTREIEAAKRNQSSDLQMDDATAKASFEGVGQTNNVDILERSHVKTPLKPLDTARRALIQKAPMVDLTWVHVAGNYSQHPHRGARDANGNFGYVPDPTALRKSPPMFQYENLKQGCALRDGDYKMLTQKVFVDLDAHKRAELSGTKRDKILCIVYSTEDYHDRIPFIRETWGYVRLLL